MSQLYVVTEFEFTLLSVFYLRFDRFVLPFLCQVSQSFRSFTRSFVEQSSARSFLQMPVFGIGCQFLRISLHDFKPPSRTTLRFTRIYLSDLSLAFISSSSFMSASMVCPKVSFVCADNPFPSK